MGINIFMIPKNHEYIKRLKLNLERQGINVQILKPFHYSTLTNVMKLLWFRPKGNSIIHVHWLYIFPCSLVMKGFVFFCRLLQIKIVWEMHNILPHQQNKRSVADSRWFYEHADAVIFHCRDDQERAAQIYHTQIRKPNIIVPHGNFNESYPNTISKEEARNILGLPENGRVILCFGFIRRNRGYEYLIEATRQMECLTLIIAGSILETDVYHELRAYEKQLTHLRVFGKWIPDEELQVFFNASDMVVLPYVNITTSGVIPLAYSFSRPVISTLIGGICEVVPPEVGILVPCRDVQALRAAIDEMYRRDYQAMGRFARDFAADHFNWATIANEIKQLYQTLF
jgi:glycosyltransferase involved in cell wall biosynthesis